MKSNVLKKTVISITFLVDMLITFFVINITAKLVNLYMDVNPVGYIFSVVMCVSTFFFLVMYELYSFKADVLRNVIISVMLSIIATSVISCVLNQIFVWTYQGFSFWTVYYALYAALMLAWRIVVAFFAIRKGEKIKLLIIENMKNTSRLARKIKYASNAENESWYWMLDEDDKNEIELLVNEKMKEYDSIFISPAISAEVSEYITTKALIMNKTVNVLADVYSVTKMKGRIYQIDDTPVVEQRGIYLTKFDRFIKRTFDIVFSLVVAIVTLPVLAISALAIKLDSEGPVIYKQERYTKNKKVFNCYKLRTMRLDAEEKGAQFATEDDPRITKVGKVLRSLRLDELPQVYNILFGQMSVVGPRPERPIFADEFSKVVKNYDMRYCLKAGLTGYAQVYGRYNTRVSDKILMDMLYGATYSFALDIKIILLTVKIMFMKSATMGVDDALDLKLASPEREQERRKASISFAEDKNV